ncbi:MAG TPA: hypothetical protein DDZ83_04475 [Nitrospinae bacterium]|jgi:antitoxin component of MazEF toxin-antitoxin module|nr:hypothetical protein [Nitrospinota bacterium]
MSDKNIHIQDIGEGGRIRLPKEVMKALGVVPGNQLKIEIRGELISIARHHVKDPFAEAAKKKSPDLKELMEQQKVRKKEAEEQFKKGMQEKHEIRPEDREEFWR